MLAMGPRDLNSAPYSPVHCSSHSMTSFQSSELTELPVVKNSQLFAQRTHSARYAPMATQLLRYERSSKCTLCLLGPCFVNPRWICIERYRLGTPLPHWSKRHLPWADPD